MWKYIKNIAVVGLLFQTNQQIRVCIYQILYVL